VARLGGVGEGRGQDRSVHAGILRLVSGSSPPHLYAAAPSGNRPGRGDADLPRVLYSFLTGSRWLGH